MVDKIAANIRQFEAANRSTQDDKLAKEIEGHRVKMVGEALKILAKKEIASEDVSITFLMRHLLCGLFSPILAEKQAALNSLLTIKGLKSTRSLGSHHKKPKEGDHVDDLMKALRGDT